MPLPQCAFVRNSWMWKQDLTTVWNDWGKTEKLKCCNKIWCYCFCTQGKTFIFFIFAFGHDLPSIVCIQIQKIPQMCPLKPLILGEVVEWGTAVCILSEIDCFKWKKVSGNSVQMKNVRYCQYPQCLMSFQKGGLQLPVMALH